MGGKEYASGLWGSDARSEPGHGPSLRGPCPRDASLFPPQGLWTCSSLLRSTANLPSPPPGGTPLHILSAYPASRWVTIPPVWVHPTAALEKAMAPHSSALAWSIPGTGEPGGLPSMGSHRVGHDWCDAAAAACQPGTPPQSRWSCLCVLLSLLTLLTEESLIDESKGANISPAGDAHAEKDHGFLSSRVSSQNDPLVLSQRFGGKQRVPGGSDGKESICLQCGRPGFNLGVGKIPWRRKWQPTPVFSPGESHGQRRLAATVHRSRNQTLST